MLILNVKNGFISIENLFFYSGYPIICFSTTIKYR